MLTRTPVVVRTVATATPVVVHSASNTVTHHSTAGLPPSNNVDMNKAEYSQPTAGMTTSYDHSDPPPPYTAP